MENTKFILTAQVTEIGELDQIRRTTKPDLYKRILRLETSDAQVLYAEIRNAALKVLDREGIIEGTIVEVSISFQGSMKGDKRYNNILITSIKRV